MLTGLERIKLVGEIANLRAKIASEQSGLEKIKAVQRIYEIRKLLGDAIHYPSADAIDLNDQAAIDAFVDAELKRLDSDVTQADIDSANALHSFRVSVNVPSPKPVSQDILNDGASVLPSSFSDLLSSDDSENIALELGKAKQALISSFWNDPALTEQWATYHESISAEVNKVKEELNEIHEKFRKTRPPFNAHVEYREWESRLTSELASIKLRFNKALKKRDGLEKAWKEAQIKEQLDQINNKLAELYKPGQVIIQAIAEKSSITQEQAEAFANSVLFDANALKSLKKAGYPEDQLRKDIAEFYRITGGKVAPLRIASGDGSGRASAQMGGDAALDIIRIDGSFNKRVLWHEMGHSVEFSDFVAKAAANEFLARRRESEKLYSLKSLTGANYKSNEAAYKDSFFHPYVGKYYQGGVTEVISMGFECLSSPQRAAKLAAEDKEHLELVLGYASQEMRPLSKLRLRKASQNKGAISQATRSREELLSSVLKLSKKIKLDQSHALTGLERETFELRLIAPNLKYKANYSYAGKISDFYAYRGLVREYASRRYITGYFLSAIPSDFGVEAYSGSYNATGSYDRTIKTVRGEDEFLLLKAFHFFDAKGSSSSAYLTPDHRLGSLKILDSKSIPLNELQDCLTWLQANYG